MMTHTLPQGWEIKRLGDIIDIQGGSQPPKSEFIYEPKDGYIQLLQIRDFGEKGVPTFVPRNRVTKFCNDDDVLIARYGASLGRIVTGLSGAYNVALAKTIFDAKVLNNRFVYFLLQTQIFQVPLTMISRSAQNGFAKHEIAHIEIPVPPLETQQAIVQKIETLFAQIDAGTGRLKTAQTQLKQYRQSLLKNAFNGELSRQWREQNAEQLPTASELLTQIQTARQAHHETQLADWQNAVKEWEQAGKIGKKPSKPPLLSILKKSEKGNVLPENWLIFTADFLCDFITKGTTPPKNELFSGNGEIPFLKVYNLTKNGQLDFTIDPTFVTHETHNNFLNRSKVYPNDVLMNIVGPPLGKVSIVSDDYEEWNINQAIVIYRSKFLNSKFLANYLLAENTINLMSAKAKTTAGQHNLTLEICRNLPIPYCSLAEQTQIVTILEQKLTACDALATELANGLKQAELLKQAVLKSAFSGSLLNNATQ